MFCIIFFIIIKSIIFDDKINKIVNININKFFVVIVLIFKLYLNISNKLIILDNIGIFISIIFLGLKFKDNLKYLNNIKFINKNIFDIIIVCILNKFLCCVMLILFNLFINIIRFIVEFLVIINFS